MQILSSFSSFSVDNLDAAESFYKEKLGLSVDRTEMGLDMKIGTQAVFIYEKKDHVPAAFTVLNLAVENLDEAVEELVQKGVTFERYEGMHQDEKAIARGKEAGMGPDIAWFKDPAGNILSVLQ